MSVWKRLGATALAAGKAWRATAKRDVLLDPDLEKILKASRSSASAQFLNWVMSSITADEDLRRNARRLRARARDLQDSTPYVGHALSLISDGVIGPKGPRMVAELTDGKGNRLDTTNDEIEKGWSRYGRRPVTLDGRFPLVPFMRLQLDTAFRDGESFTRIWRGRKLNPWGLALEAIDPDLIDEQLNVPASKGQNEICLGIERDSFGRPVAYHVLPAVAPAGLQRGERERVPAEDIIHFFRPRRVNQTRGMTALLPVLVSLKMEQDYGDAELMAAAIGAAKCFVYEQQRDGSGGAEVRDEDEDGEFQTEVAPGVGWKLPAGWTVKMLETDHPATAYGPFVKAVVRKIAIGFGMSYHSLSGDLESTSFSSGRIGMLQERDFYENVQEFFFSMFLDRVCLEWLKTASLLNRITLPTYDPELYAEEIKWIGRGYSYVDPVKEVTGDLLRLQGGFTSLQRIHAEQGQDFEDVLKERQRDRDLIAKYGDTLTMGAPPVTVTDDEETGKNKPDDDEKKGRGATVEVHLNGNGNGQSRLGAVMREDRVVLERGGSTR